MDSNFSLDSLGSKSRSLSRSHVSVAAEYTKEDTFIPKNTEVLVKKTNAKQQLEALRTNPTGSSAPPRQVYVVQHSSKSFLDMRSIHIL